MCGISGFLDFGDSRSETLESIVREMAECLRHRGPDDSGIWVDAQGGIALGHRRLAVIDLSTHGHQPMLSACGRWVCVLNGEIYNFDQLRHDLEINGAIKWRGHSDTEVLLESVARTGVAKTIERLNGMFAFALWDRDQRELYLARDRAGEKPLYYGWLGQRFAFSSELKALRRDPQWRGEIDHSALEAYFEYSYVPGPRSIYRNVHKLPPGSVVRIRRTSSMNVEPVATRYWSLARAFGGNEEDPAVPIDDVDAVRAVGTLLRDSVRLRMIADVPVGIFLSGGVDSSLIAAVAQEEMAGRVRTFTVGFDSPGFNEAAHARQVAEHLGTDHTNLYVTATDALAVVPRLPAIFDEPFSDSSQIPTFLISELARRHVTVALSGDGGDELFGGYNRYRFAPAVWNRVRWLPGPVRRATERLLKAIPDSLVRRFAANAFRPSLLHGDRAGEALRKVAAVIGAADEPEVFARLVAQPGASNLLLGAHELRDSRSDWLAWDGDSEFVAAMMRCDVQTYLPDDILVKVDRASMAVALESRAPYLDHRLMELAFRLPNSLKIRGKHGKWILRRLLEEQVPPALTDRPKVGFAVPLAGWLRGPLREWASELLRSDRVMSDGYLDHQLIRRYWNEQLNGRRDRSHLLWTVLMFQAWLHA